MLNVWLSKDIDELLEIYFLNLSLRMRSKLFSLGKEKCSMLKSLLERQNVKVIVTLMLISWIYKINSALDCATATLY